MAGRADPQVKVMIDCSPWKPIFVSKADVLTDTTARAVLDHNRTGARLCGWKPNTTPAEPKH